MGKRIDLSDDQLVEKFISGEKWCIEVLIRRHQRKILSFIMMAVRNRELAEDVFQDAFIKAIDSLQAGRYQANGKFSQWVMRIAHNLIIDYHRKNSQHKTISGANEDYDLFNNLKYAEQTIEEKIIYDQILAEVGQLVDLLPDTQREVIVMRHYQDLSFKEIAEETNVSINTALGRMRYALMNLRKLMDEKNISLSVK